MTSAEALNPVINGAIAVTAAFVRIKTAVSMEKSPQVNEMVSAPR